MVIQHIGTYLEFYEKEITCNRNGIVKLTSLEL